MAADCDEIADDIHDALLEQGEALADLMEERNDLKDLADDIRESHDYFDEKTMSDREIVEAQIDLVELAREETAAEIRELHDQLGEGGDDERIQEGIDSLEQYMKDLDEAEERFAETVDDYGDALGDFAEASAELGEAMKNWVEHCTKPK